MGYNYESKVSKEEIEQVIFKLPALRGIKNVY